MVRRQIEARRDVRVAAYAHPRHLAGLGRHCPAHRIGLADVPGLAIVRRVAVRADHAAAIVVGPRPAHQGPVSGVVAGFAVSVRGEADLRDLLAVDVQLARAVTGLAVPVEAGRGGAPVDVLVAGLALLGANPLGGALDLTGAVEAGQLVRRQRGHARCAEQEQGHGPRHAAAIRARFRPPFVPSAASPRSQSSVSPPPARPVPPASSQWMSSSRAWNDAPLSFM